MYQLAIAATVQGATPNHDPSSDIVSYNVTNSSLNLSTALSIVSGGGEVYNYPVFIKIVNSSDLVPEGIIGRTYEDDEGNEAIHTWETWIKSNDSIIEREGQLYVYSSSYNGTPLPISELNSLSSDLIKEEDLPKLEDVEP